MGNEPAQDDNEAARKERAARLRQQIEKLKKGSAGAEEQPPVSESPREKIDRATHGPKKPTPAKD